MTYQEVVCTKVEGSTYTLDDEMYEHCAKINNYGDRYIPSSSSDSDDQAEIFISNIPYVSKYGRVRRPTRRLDLQANVQVCRREYFKIKLLWIKRREHFRVYILCLANNATEASEIVTYIACDNYIIYVKF